MPHNFSYDSAFRLFGGWRSPLLPMGGLLTFRNIYPGLDVSCTWSNNVIRGLWRLRAPIATNDALAFLPVQHKLRFFYCFVNLLLELDVLRRKRCTYSGWRVVLKREALKFLHPSELSFHISIYPFQFIYLVHLHFYVKSWHCSFVRGNVTVIFKPGKKMLLNRKRYWKRKHAGIVSFCAWTCNNLFFSYSRKMESFLLCLNIFESLKLVQQPT